MTASPQTLERTAQQLRHHFEIERDLAQRLMHTPAPQRLAQYAQVYDELFRRVPDHPQLNPAPLALSTSVREQWPWLQPYVRPHHHLLEIGPGDGALARWACAHVRQVSTVDVSHTMLSAALREPVPVQLRAQVFDGVHLPLPNDAVDLAFSHQLMEHLHPEDAADQLADIARVLRPGGRYVCVTPHRYSGPHDISAHFSNTPLGLHLREYTGTELCALMRGVGFERADVMVRVQGRLLHLPDALLHLMEGQLAQLSAGQARRERMRRKPYAWLSTLCVVGQMPHSAPRLKANRDH